MQGEDLENAADAFPSAIPRATPRSRFAERLGAEIRQAARQQTAYEGGLSFEDVVVELRKLVRLLCDTLVPTRPRPEFSRALGDQLLAYSAVLQEERQRQRRWLMLGGVVGSVLGVLAAVLLWRRGDQVRTKKPASAL